jgi:ryanodine receptor 2
MKEYIPEPIDTSDVTIPDYLSALAEQLARNTHEVWSSGRLSQGWIWGAARDDVKKTHPDLIPYEELPDSEKEFDRQTSQETLKLILSLGYKIVRPE